MNLSSYINIFTSFHYRLVYVCFATSCSFCTCRNATFCHFLVLDQSQQKPPQKNHIKDLISSNPLCDLVLAPQWPCEVLHIHFLPQTITIKTKVPKQGALTNNMRFLSFSGCWNHHTSRELLTSPLLKKNQDNVPTFTGAGLDKFKPETFARKPSLVWGAMCTDSLKNTSQCSRWNMFHVETKQPKGAELCLGLFLKNT